MCLAGPASAQNNIDQGRRQFEKAVSLRTELESHPQGQRTLEAYRQVLAAYKKVYAYTSDAEIVTPSLVASAELSIEMGRQYDPAFFKMAIGSYNYLLKEYPHSRYASSALFSIADIQQNELKDPDSAEKTYKEFIQKFPKSPRIVEARIAIKQIAQARNDASAMPATAAHSRQPAAGRTAILSNPLPTSLMNRQPRRSIRLKAELKPASRASRACALGTRRTTRVW